MRGICTTQETKTLKVSFARSTQSFLTRLHSKREFTASQNIIKHKNVFSTIKRISQARLGLQCYATNSGAAEVKEMLRFALSGTSRGGAINTEQRGFVEEAQVALESYGGPLDFSLLEGTWKLLYTTARDVVPLVAPPSLPISPLQVGSIYQQFSSLEEGRVKNIIKLSVPFLLAEEDGVSITVGARYKPRGSQSILLTFEDLNVGGVHISPLFESLLAPAILPRTWVNQQILLALKELSITLPLSARPLGSSNGNAGGTYQLTYLDDDMLVGRQGYGGGTFIFTRDS